MSDYTYNFADGSQAIHWVKRYSSDEYLPKVNYIDDGYQEIIGFTDNITDMPIKGKYIVLKSNNVIILGGDSIYEFNVSDRSIKRCPPYTILWIVDANQSNRDYFDDYITYVKFINNGNTIDNFNECLI